MNCPDTDTLVAFAVGDPALRDHVAVCPACGARLDGVRSALARLEAAHATPDRDHEAGRARLLAALATEPVPYHPTLLRRILMDRRTWVSSAAGVVILAAAMLLGWGGSPAAALADALQPFKEAKSFSCDMVPLRDGKPAPGTDQMSFRITWAAPGSLRGEIRSGVKQQETIIVPHGKSGVILNHRDKTYLPTGEKAGAQEAALLKLIGGLGAYSGGDQKAAGTDPIGNVKAPRFDLTVTDATAKEVSWRARVWVHPETKRPLRVEFALQAGQDPAAKGVSTVRLDEFAWDVRVDGLFDTTPPAGYTSAVLGK